MYESLNVRGMSEKMKRRLFPETLVYLADRGSTVHGTYLPPTSPNGTDDIDLFAVFVPPKEFYFGFRSAKPSRNNIIDEWDIEAHEFTKFVLMLLKCNPNIIGNLWLPDEFVYYKHPIMGFITTHRDAFLGAKLINKAFYGYAQSKMNQIKEGALNGYMGAKRKEVVKRFGYDVKNASHLIRLYSMGIELLRDGKVSFPRPEAELLKDIKDGRLALKEVMDHAECLTVQYDSAYAHTFLPPEPDRKLGEALCVRALEAFWRNPEVNTTISPYWLRAASLKGVLTD